jgi:ribulose-phosphate 3-epimerase
MSQRDRILDLRNAAPAILPSLLLCDFANLQQEVERLEAAGVPALHLDVMDGHFVPNLTYGMPIVEALRRVSQLPLDVHLMISRPERLVDEFCRAGADLVTVHVEATEDPRLVLEGLRKRGVGAGLALNPQTPLQTAEKYLDACDLLLVMSVPAGFGGQSFDPVALDKLRQARQLAGSHVVLEVDGGINQQTIGPCALAGAHAFVVGSAIFGRSDYAEVVADLVQRASLVKG